MLASILSFFTSTAFKGITGRLLDAYEAKLKAENDEQRLKAEVEIAFLEAQQSILLKEQQRWYTAWIRPAFATVVLIFWAKVVVWDTVLQWGVTPYPGEHVMWFVTLIPAAYFLVRPFETRR